MNIQFIPANPVFMGERFIDPNYQDSELCLVDVAVWSKGYKNYMIGVTVGSLKRMITDLNFGRSKSIIEGSDFAYDLLAGKFLKQRDTFSVLYGNTANILNLDEYIEKYLAVSIPNTAFKYGIELTVKHGEGEGAGYVEFTEPSMLFRWNLYAEKPFDIKAAMKLARPMQAVSAKEKMRTRLLSSLIVMLNDNTAKPLCSPTIERTGGIITDEMALEQTCRKELAAELSVLSDHNVDAIIDSTIQAVMPALPECYFLESGKAVYSREQMIQFAHQSMLNERQNIKRELSNKMQPK